MSQREADMVAASSATSADEDPFADLRRDVGPQITSCPAALLDAAETDWSPVERKVKSASCEMVGEKSLYHLFQLTRTVTCRRIWYFEASILNNYVCCAHVSMKLFLSLLALRKPCPFFETGGAGAADLERWRGDNLHGLAYSSAGRSPLYVRADSRHARVRAQVPRH